jgi:hypothetical protein
MTIKVMPCHHAKATKAQVFAAHFKLVTKSKVVVGTFVGDSCYFVRQK